MSKKALVDQIEPQFESRAAAEKAIDAVTKGIVDLVRGGEAVVLRDFGKFKRQHRAERTGRNPRTGEPVKVAAQEKLAFSSKVTF